MMEGVRNLLTENMREMAQEFDSCLGNVRFKASAIDEERNKAAERISTMSAEFQGQADKVTCEMKSWDVASRESCGSVRVYQAAERHDLHKRGRSQQNGARTN